MSETGFVQGEVYAVINYRLNEVERRERKLIRLAQELQEYRLDIQRLAKEYDVLDFLASECFKRYNKQQQQREYEDRNNV